MSFGGDGEPSPTVEGGVTAGGGIEMGGDEADKETPRADALIRAPGAKSAASRGCSNRPSKVSGKNVATFASRRTRAAAASRAAISAALVPAAVQADRVRLLDELLEPLVLELRAVPYKRMSGWS